jgi:hypothetical protein
MWDGSLRAWGAGGRGQLGDGDTINSSYPVMVYGLSGVQAVSAGPLHSLALNRDGQVMAWGANTNGQLVDGTQTDQPTPVAARPSGVTAISAGGTPMHGISYYIEPTGVGFGGVVTPEITPLVDGNGDLQGATGITAIAAGGGYLVMQNASGTIAIGEGQFGQLGNGTLLDSDTPVRVHLPTANDMDGDIISNSIEAQLTGSSTGLTVQVVSGSLVSATQAADSSITFRMAAGPSSVFAAATADVVVPQGFVAGGGTIAINIIAAPAAPAGGVVGAAVVAVGADIQGTSKPTLPTPLPVTKSIILTAPTISTHVCIVDASATTTLADLVGAPNCVTNTSQSMVKLPCPSAATAFTGFPDAPSTRTYSCTVVPTVDPAVSNFHVTGFNFSAVSTFLDRDNDGVADGFDSCPTVSGKVEFQGCGCAVAVKVRTNSVHDSSRLTPANVSLFDKAMLKQCAGFTPRNPASALACQNLNTRGYDPLSMPNGVIIGHQCGKDLYVTAEANGETSGHNTGVNSSSKPQPRKITMAFHRSSDDHFSGSLTEEREGSLLSIFEPLYTIISGDKVYYPFSFQGEDIPSGESWTVDACTQAPPGYKLVDGQSCQQALVANEVKVLEFELVEVGTVPQKTQPFKFSMKNPEGKHSKLDTEVENRATKAFCDKKGLDCDEKGRVQGEKKKQGWGDGQATTVSLLTLGTLMGGTYATAHVIRRRRKKAGKTK